MAGFEITDFRCQIRLYSGVCVLGLGGLIVMVQQCVYRRRRNGTEGIE